MKELENPNDTPVRQGRFCGDRSTVAEIRGEGQQPRERKALSKSGDQNAQPEPLVTTKKAAQILGVSERTLWALTARGEIPRVLIGRAVRYDPADLRAFVASKKRVGK